MSHRYHPDPDRGDPPEAILWDDCEDCHHHAMELTLDGPSLHRLLKTLDGQWGHRPTGNERLAERHLWRALLVMELERGPDRGTPIADALLGLETMARRIEEASEVTGL